jgi:hypothetical protein
MKEAYDPDKDDVTSRRVDKFMQHYQVRCDSVVWCGVMQCDLLFLDYSVIFIYHLAAQCILFVEDSCCTSRLDNHQISALFLTNVPLE